MNNGIHVHEINPYYVHALAEHRELHTAIERIRSLLNSDLTGDAAALKGIEATHAVLALRDHLRRHFTQEEAGGYLEEAVTRLPRIAPQASALQRQHRELLDAVERLLPNPDAVVSGKTALATMKDEFEIFVRRLLAHEAAENVLLEQAFNEAPGLDP